MLHNLHNLHIFKFLIITNRHKKGCLKMNIQRLWKRTMLHSTMNTVSIFFDIYSQMHAADVKEVVLKAPSYFSVPKFRINGTY